MAKLVLFNVKYSPNLGDGVIAECFEHALRKHGRFSEVVSLDLAGRTGFRPPAHGGRRARLLSLLDRLPEWGRDAAFALLLGHAIRTRLRPSWRKGLSDAAVAVFGGGQLIQDGDLNFPMKLSAAAAECRRLGVPMAMHAVGAAQSRSFRGRRLFEAPLEAAKGVFLSVRDTQSVENLASYGFIADAVCRDPGLLASRVWPMPVASRLRKPVVGLCVTHSSVLRHHASHGDALDEAAAIACYRRAVENLVEDGYGVTCFTNGAGEDELMLRQLRAALAASSSPHAVAEFAQRPDRPAALAALVSGFDAVVAHRLHAVILAYSYGLPVVGLRWDDKLTAFLESVGLGHHAHPFDEVTAANLAGFVRASMRQPVSAAARSAVLDRVESDVRRLVEAIERRLDPAAEEMPRAAPQALYA